MNLFVSLIFTGLLVAANVCPEGVDRDLKIAVTFDGTSSTRHAEWSLPYIADALSDLDSWVQESGFSLLVSKHRIGDALMSPYWCSSGYEVNLAVADIGPRIGQMDYIHYLPLPTPMSSAAMIFFINDAWPRKYLHVERRIYVHASSNGPIIGEKDLPLNCSGSLGDLCPTHNRGSLRQLQEFVRGHGVAIFAWIWFMYPSPSPQLDASKQQWNTWLESVGVTDYYMMATGGSDNLPKAREWFKEGIRTLACPPWIASTSTYEFYAPGCPNLHS